MIIAGCAVSSSPGLRIVVACTNEVPFQLEVTRGAGDTGSGQQEPQVSLAPGTEDGAVNVVVTY